jgi:hypothetical protein
MPMSDVSRAEARRQTARARKQIVKTARRTVGARLSTLIMLCRRWGDAASRRAAKSLERSLKSARPQPACWNLDRILAALTNGASDVDVGARRLAADLRVLVSELEELAALERSFPASVR